MSKETRFLTIYARLPLGARKEIIAVIQGEPMTWQVCSIEVKAKTKMGRIILNYLDRLNFI